MALRQEHGVNLTLETTFHRLLYAANRLRIALITAGAPSDLETTLRIPAEIASSSRLGTRCEVNIKSGVAGMIRLSTRAV